MRCKALSISHACNTQLHTPFDPLTLSNVLCVPQIQKNLILVAEICKNNCVSVDIFPSHFL
ncbi:hypothetical protein HanRHA438_Chr07g0317541 [Helianthus annuus]|nr:hypothetical protein HanRHA438_Chr07g0317541 [Helianthus annuus]